MKYTHKHLEPICSFSHDVWQQMSKTTSSSSNRRLLNVKVCLKLGRTTLWSSFGNPSDKPNELKWVSENMLFAFRRLPHS
jgi:hypothetical protein